MRILARAFDPDSHMPALHGSAEYKVKESSESVSASLRISHDEWGT